MGLEGQTFAGYKVISKLGQGGMGEVYMARQPVLDRTVALKVLSAPLAADESFVARFRREAAAAAKFTHPNLVQVYAAGESQGTYYIAMEFVEGESLKKRLAREGQIPIAESLGIAVQAAQALRYAWSTARLIHRDIKPDNIFLSRAGAAKVGDLGLAKIVGTQNTDLTETDMIIGSPYYISPEQAHGAKDIDFRADIYSLGCTLFHLLTGRRPFNGDSSMAIIAKHIYEPPPDLRAVMPACPACVDALLTKMLAKKRNQRHASYEELIREMTAAYEEVRAAGHGGQIPLSPGTAKPVRDQLPPGAGLTDLGERSPINLSPAERISQVNPPDLPTPSPTPRQTASRSTAHSRRRAMIYGLAAVAVVAIALGWRWSAGRADSAKQTATTAARASGILAPPETRVAVLTAKPKIGDVYALALGSNVTLELMGIPPGEFLMGSPPAEQAWALQNQSPQNFVRNEGAGPRRAAVKPGFWMGRTEVTVGQWKQFVNETGYVTDGEREGTFTPLRKGTTWEPTKGVCWRNPGFGFEIRDEHPVSCISWNDAVAFCRWLTRREHAAGRLPPGYATRLPTETEWAYACRAGTQTRFWWGDQPNDGNQRLNWASGEDGFDLVAPVDHYRLRGRNGFGLADMLGNVQEWCWDAFGPTAAHNESWTANPAAHVVRGGSFGDPPAICRAAHRRGSSPSHASINIGFRIVIGSELSPSQTAAPPSSAAAASDAAGILAPSETRVTTLTTDPKIGDVCALALGSNATLELMGIPAGDFLLGSTRQEKAWALANNPKEKDLNREGDAPRQAAIAHAFWMGRTDVTVGQWKQFVLATGYVTDGERNGASVAVQPGGTKSLTAQPGTSWRNPGFGFQPRDDHPICCVSWNDAKAFCEWLDGRERRAGRLAPGYALRLPTEAEWEYACRAGTQTWFWWGDAPEDGRRRLNCAGSEGALESVARVDSYGPRGRNRFGLADMLGNVYQWCLDDYDGMHAHDALWTGNAYARVLRGGSFHDFLVRCRCAYRIPSHPAYSFSIYGFRIVVGPELTGPNGSSPTAGR